MILSRLFGQVFANILVHAQLLCYRTDEEAEGEELFLAYPMSSETVSLYTL